MSICCYAFEEMFLDGSSHTIRKLCIEQSNTSNKIHNVSQDKLLSCDFVMYWDAEKNWKCFFFPFSVRRIVSAVAVGWCVCVHAWWAHLTCEHESVHFENWQYSSIIEVFERRFTSPHIEFIPGANSEHRVNSQIIFVNLYMI